MRSGRIDLSAMVTHTYGLADAAEAFATASTKRDDAIKVLLEP